MKTLVLYYSLDGNTELIANKIQEKLNCSIERIETSSEIVNKNSFMKYLWGGRMVFMKEIPEILELKNNLSDFDNIIIGTPVWAWGYSPPIQALFEKYQIKNKKVAIFCCHGGGMGKTLEKMKKELIENVIIGEIDFKEPKKDKSDYQIIKLNEWIENISNVFDK